MDVSIIIVNFNAFELLNDCLKSIVDFTSGITYEIIVVDNNSSGDVKKITDKYKNVILIKNRENKGFAAANNQALLKAKGKYVLFLNNDTKLEDNVIKKIFDFSENLYDDIIVGCELKNSDGTRQNSIMKSPSLWNSFAENFFLYKIFPKSKYFNKYYQNLLHFNNPIEVDEIKGAFMFCTLSAIKKLQGFDERFFFYSEETDLCYRFKKNGGKIYFFPFNSIIHYEGEIEDKNLLFYHKNLSIGKIKFYQKHFNQTKFYIALIFHYIGIASRIPLYLLSGLFLFRKQLLKKSMIYLQTLFIYPKNLFKNKKQ